MSEDFNERFERRAEQFYRDSGMMAPGKDQPAAAGGPDFDERMAAWKAWCVKHQSSPSTGAQSDENT